MSRLDEYRDTLERVRGGTVPTGLALEILDVAEAELEHAHGEYTLAQAMEMSGRSRSYFERRLPRLAREGLARKPGREWLIRRAAIPGKPEASDEGFDPDMPVEDIVSGLLAD